MKKVEKKNYHQQVTFGIISGTRKKISNYSDEVGRTKGVRGQGPAKIKTALRRGDTRPPSPLQMLSNCVRFASRRRFALN